MIYGIIQGAKGRMGALGAHFTKFIRGAGFVSKILLVFPSNPGFNLSSTSSALRVSSSWSEFLARRVRNPSSRTWWPRRGRGASTYIPALSQRDLWRWPAHRRPRRLDTAGFGIPGIHRWRRFRLSIVKGGIGRLPAIVLQAAWLQLLAAAIFGQIVPSCASVRWRWGSILQSSFCRSCWCCRPSRLYTGMQEPDFWWSC